MNKNKYQINQLMKELYDQGISMQKFLVHYCGVSIENFSDMKMSHSDVKILMPSLKRISYETLLKNKDDLYRGKVIAVIDSYNHVAPYVTPELSLECNSVIIKKEDEQKQSIIENAILNEDLNTYELSILCKAYKKTGRMREYRIADNLLKRKTHKVKQYKKSKELLRMKGIEL